MKKLTALALLFLAVVATAHDGHDHNDTDDNSTSDDTDENEEMGTLNPRDAVIGAILGGLLGIAILGCILGFIVPGRTGGTKFTGWRAFLAVVFTIGFGAVLVGTVTGNWAYYNYRESYHSPDYRLVASPFVMCETETDVYCWELRPTCWVYDDDDNKVFEEKMNEKDCHYMLTTQAFSVLATIFSGFSWLFYFLVGAKFALKNVSAVFGLLAAAFGVVACVSWGSAQYLRLGFLSIVYNASDKWLFGPSYGVFIFGFGLIFFGSVFAARLCDPAQAKPNSAQGPAYAAPGTTQAASI